MSATGKDLHIDTFLSNFAINYHPSNMIGEMVAPLVPVMKQSNTFPIWSLADAFKTADDKRAPNNEANILVQGVSSDTYYCDNYALKMPLTIEDRENADDAIISELREGRVRRIRDNLLLNQEVRVANLVNSTSNVGSSSGVNSGWSDLDAGDSDPIGDITTAIQNVRGSTGYQPNKMIIGIDAWDNLKRHADIISAVWGTSGVGRSRFVRAEQIAELFELDQVFIGRAYQNTAGRGQTATMGSIWGDNCLVYYAPDTATMDDPTFMAQMRWRRAGLPDMQAEVHPFDSRRKSEEVELGYYQDEKVTASALGFLITDCNSA